MGQLKQGCDTTATTAITYKTADDFTDEQVINYLSQGKRVTELPLLLGCDGSVAVQLANRAMDNYFIVDIMRDQKLSFIIEKKFLTDLTAFAHQKVLDGEMTIKEYKDTISTYRDHIDVINRTFSTQADLFTKVTDSHTQEFVKVCEKACFALLDKWDGQVLDAAKAKEEFIEMLGRL
jgi:tellurite resistance-related uncharacterized protein